MRSGRLSRRELLAGAAAAGALGAATASDAQAASSGGGPDDAGVLRETLGVELLVAFCYQQVLERGILGAQAEQVASLMLVQERAHIRALTAALAARGGTAPPAPTSPEQADRELAARHSSGRLKGVRSQLTALDLLYGIEEVAIGAYYKALEKLVDPDLVVTSLQIMGAEAQHAAAIGTLLHPGKFDRIAPVAEVRGRT